MLNPEGMLFWWVVASVEEVSIEIYRPIHKHRTTVDPLFHVLHQRHLEDEARHRNYAFLMLNLIQERQSTLRRYYHRKTDLLLAQTLSSVWVIAELSKVFEVQKFKKEHPYFETLASCLPLMKKLSLVDIFRRFFVSAPYVSVVLNLKHHKHTFKTSEKQQAFRFPFPDPKPAKVTPGETMTGEVKTVVLRGLQTGWVESGRTDGPLLVFMHGAPDSPAVWDLQAEAFSTDFQVIRPFARGMIPSEPSKDLARYGLESVALDLLEIISQVDPSGLRPIFCVGHDLGAVHACNLARLLGGRLRGLIIFNGLSLDQMLRRLKNPNQLLRSWYIYLNCLPGLGELATARFPLSLLRLAYRFGGLEESVTPPEAEAQDPIEGLALKHYRALLRDLPTQSSERYPRIKAPVLVIWGRKDPFLVVPEASEWERFSSEAEVRILDGGHWIYRERAAEVNALLQDFLKKNLKPEEGRKVA